MPIIGPMELNAAHLDADRNPLSEFCALEYRPRDWSVASSIIAPVIVLVLRDKEGGLHFLVHTELRAIVRGEDLAFIESLLQDFTERTKLHPEALFKHLCSLGVGPLVTQAAGSTPLGHPAIQELSSTFVEFPYKAWPSSKGLPSSK
jgi:hypothetical protein